MLFCSYIFILLFLPLCVAGYYLLAGRFLRLAQGYLLGMSLIFYGYFNWMYLLILLSSLAVNFSLGRLLFVRRQKFLLWLGILFNVALLGYFKYYDFFVSNINSIFGTSFVLKHILLPLGISFYTFQQIAYLSDICNGRLQDRYSPLTYALFVTFFPQLIAGPIVLPEEMMPQFADPANRKINMLNFSSGIFIFAAGLAKKILLADHFAIAADTLFAAPQPDCLSCWSGALSYMMQIYFDFSGYCDMAIGIALLFNIQLPVNFSSPYRAGNIQEFWRKWHITLGRFLSQFIYFPLGGSRNGQWRTCRNLLITFFISGLWHGAGWTFVLWGVLHGVAMLIHHFWSKVWAKSMPKVAGWGITFLFILLAWVLFRAESLGTAIKVYTGMFSGNFAGFEVSAMDILYWIAAFGILFLLPPLNTFAQKKHANIATWIAAFVLLLMSLFSLSRITPFIYFNF